MNKIEIIRRIVTNSQHEKVTISVNIKNRKILIDGITANALLTIYNALKPELQEKFNSISWPKLINFAWKHIK